MTALAPSSRLAVAWFILIVLGAAWGATIPLTKIAVSEGNQPFGLIFWQLVISSAALAGLQFFSSHRQKFNREILFYFLVIGFIGTILPNSFSYLAAQHLPGGILSLMIAIVPMVTLVMALVLKLESPSFVRLLGVLVGFTAMLMLLLPDTSLPDPSKALFILVAMVAPICYAGEANYVALKAQRDTDPLSTVLYSSIIGAFIMAPIAFGSGQWIDLSSQFGKPEWALVLSSLIHAFTYSAYLWLVRFGGPVFSVQMAYPVTLSGVFLSMYFLEESYSGWVWGALITLIVGLTLVQPRGEK